MSRAFLLATTLVCVPFLPACDRSGETEEEKDSDAKGDKDSAEAKADANKDPCTQYAEALCERAGGDRSPTCSAAKTTTEIMADEACSVGLEKIDASAKKIAQMGETCTKLAEKLCADLGADTQTCAMVREQTPKMPPQQCNTMMNEYDSVLAELKGMEDRNKPLPPEKAEALAAGDAPGFGPEDAKVTVVEFSDFQCPYCSRAAESVSKLKENYGDKVRFVFRQFPLSFHKEAHLAAQASLEAHDQGKFWAYHDLLFKNQKALEREHLEKYAEQVGLDMKEFKAALDEKTYEKAVNEDLELGKTVSVSGTPTLFVNGARVANATDYDALAKTVDEALSKG